MTRRTDELLQTCTPEQLARQVSLLELSVDSLMQDRDRWKRWATVRRNKIRALRKRVAELLSRSDVASHEALARARIESMRRSSGE